MDLDLVLKLCYIVFNDLLLHSSDFKLTVEIVSIDFVIMQYQPFCLILMVKIENYIFFYVGDMNPLFIYVNRLLLSLYESFHLVEATH